MSNKKSKSQSHKDDKTHSQASKKSLNLSQNISTMEDFEDNILEIDLKRNRTAKQLFIVETFKAKYDGESMIDALPKINKEWKALSDTKKEKYEEMAREEKKRYEDHLALVRNHLIQKPPKETATAFNIFMDEAVKKAIENLEDVKEARVKAREEWNNMSKREKDKWEEKKEANKDLYEKLKNFKPGKINGYALWIKDQIAAAKEKGKSLTVTECANRWPKVKEETKEKYNDYAQELKEERDKQRDLYEITFGIKPRRPMGPYNFYLQEMSKLKKFQGSNFFQECSKSWKKLTDEDKEKYNKIAKKESLIYMVKMMEFKNFKKSTYKRAPSAFNLYVADMREKLADKDMDNKGAFDYISKKWKNEKESVVRKYQKLAEEAKKDNEQERDDYINRVYDAPKRPRSGYQIYLADRIPDLKEKHPKQPTTELFRMVAEEWKGLKENVKDKWNEKAIPSREEYKMKMKEYERMGYYIMDEEERKAKEAKKEARSQMMKSQSPKKNKVQPQSTKKKK